VFVIFRDKLGRGKLEAVHVYKKSSVGSEADRQWASLVWHVSRRMTGKEGWRGSSCRDWSTVPSTVLGRRLSNGAGRWGLFKPGADICIIQCTSSFQMLCIAFSTAWIKSLFDIE